MTRSSPQRDRYSVFGSVTRKYCSSLARPGALEVTLMLCPLTMKFHLHKKKSKKTQKFKI